jgi:signal transduction histidine kinase
MGLFVSGLVTGLLVCAVAGALLGVLAYRRYVLLERRAREAERLAELGTLTGGLAHEIKNPLSTVQLNLQLLSEELDPRDKNQQRMVHRLGVVQRETGRLREILDDFLRYAGKMELDRKPTDLNGLLEELVDFFAPQAQLQRVQLRLRRNDGPLIADVDQKFIKQALLNLLSATANDGQARIDVIDTGGGVPPEAVANIFNAYYSTKSGGNGLGLAISQRIAKEHGGSLKVQTEPGQGSDFSLTIPIDLK